MQTASEPVVLDKQDDKEGRVPVPKKRQEVLEDSQEVVSAYDTKDDNGNEDKEGPDKARNERQGLRELLDRQSAGVDGDTIHPDARHDEEDEQELGEAARIQNHLDKFSNAFIRICVCPI